MSGKDVEIVATACLTELRCNALFVMPLPFFICNDNGSKFYFMNVQCMRIDYVVINHYRLRIEQTSYHLTNASFFEGKKDAFVKYQESHGKINLIKSTFNYKKKLLINNPL